ncbi:MAG: hypothetical protein JRI68_23150 [Deltaproteobacteria bacterium]|nr:hypothetical protein [Deltaproteobacteria bacterium]
MVPGRALLLLAVMGLLPSACNAMFGVDGLCFDCATGGASSGGGTGATGGQAGAGGTTDCSAGDVQPCYEGLAGTVGVGPCEAGEQTCAPEGGSWGPCEGQVLPGAEVCGDELDQDCNGYGCGETVWALGFGDTQDDEARRVQVSPSGRVTVAGSYRGTIDLGAGPLTTDSYDEIGAFVGLLSPDGGHVASWSLQANAGGSVVAEGLAEDAAGGIVMGAELAGSVDLSGTSLVSAGNEDGLILRFSPEGAPIWGARFGGAEGDGVEDVAVLASGDVVVTGHLGGHDGDFMGTALNNHGAADVVVARLSAADGSVTWAESFGASGDQFPMGLETFAGGGAVVAGAFDNHIDFGDGELSSADGWDIFVVRLTGGGDPVWSLAYGAGGNQVPLATAVTGEGDVVVAGYSGASFAVGQNLLPNMGADDAFVIKLSGDGEPLWAQSFGSTGNDGVTGVAVAADGAIWLTGSCHDGIDFGGDPLAMKAGSEHMFVAKLAADGSHLHSRSIEMASSVDSPFNYWNYWRQVDVDASGFAYLVGHFYNQIDFGLGEMTSAGGADAFVAKLAP